MEMQMICADVTILCTERCNILVSDYYDVRNGEITAACNGMPSGDFESDGAHCVGVHLEYRFF